MKVTLITGASGGIGEAIANRFAEKRHNLLLVARNAKKLEKQCDVLAQQYSINAQFITVDLSVAGSAEEIWKETVKRGLDVDILINNAGIGSGGEFSSLALESELKLVQLNILALVSLTHLFLQPMQQRKGGTIINIASMVAFMPAPYMTTYAASKAFVRSFTEGLIQECKPYHIRMMLFCPGLTRTNFNTAAGIDNEKAGGLMADYQNAPTQTPEEVAAELLSAFEKGKTVAVSGRLNRLGASLLALVPNSLITRFSAGQYRRRLKN